MQSTTPTKRRSLNPIHACKMLGIIIVLGAVMFGMVLSGFFCKKSK